MNHTAILFVVAGALACIFLGLLVGRLVTLKGFTWTLKDAIGVTLIGAFIAVLFVLFWKVIPKENEQLIVYMLGQLSGFVAGVVSSHYGTKAGDEKLAEARNVTAQKQAEATTKLADAYVAQGGGSEGEVKKVEVVNDEQSPVPTTTAE